MRIFCFLWQLYPTPLIQKLIRGWGSPPPPSVTFLWPQPRAREQCIPHTELESVASTSLILTCKREWSLSYNSAFCCKNALFVHASTWCHVHVAGHSPHRDSLPVGGPLSVHETSWAGSRVIQEGLRRRVVADRQYQKSRRSCDPEGRPYDGFSRVNNL